MTALQLKSQLIELPVSSWVYVLSQGGVGQKRQRSKRALKKVYLASRKP